MAALSLHFPRVVNYQNIRHLLRTGDVIAFSGDYLGSDLIRVACGGLVSHMGMVVRCRYDALINDTVVEIIEANVSPEYPDLNGVVLSRLTDRVPFYKGDVWVLRLSDACRQTFIEADMEHWLVGELGKKYDLLTPWKAAVDAFDRWGQSYNPEDLSTLFCSELIAAAFKYAGMLPTINPSEITPADIVQWATFQPDYYQIKCWNYVAKAIPGYNTQPIPT